MLSMRQREVDVSLAGVVAECTASGKLDAAGGAGYLAGLMDHPILAHVDHAAEIIRVLAIRRRLVEAGHKVMKTAGDLTEDLSEVLDKAQRAVMCVGTDNGRNAFCAMSDLLDQTMDHYEDLMKHRGLGIKTGFVGLDDHLGELRPGDLMLIAARPSVGKTAFLLALALNIAGAGHPVGFFSLEMTKQQLADRLLSQTAGVNSMRLKTGNLDSDHWQRIVEASGRLYDLPLFIDDTAGLTAYEVKQRARALRRKHGIGVLIIDYLQLIGADPVRGKTRNDEVSEISRSLKGLAKELELPTIAACQLNRHSERENRAPQLSDLRDSGSLEQDSDVVAFLHRSDGNEVHLLIRKNRTGPCGTVRLHFDQATQNFRETI